MKSTERSSHTFLRRTNSILSVNGIRNNKSNLRNARRNFAFENPEFRRFSDKVVFKAGQPGRMVGSGKNARWEQQGNYYEKTERVKEKKDKSKGK